ncbi:type II secretion system secretin GspD [Rhodopila sp.]|uniref:type II secretion system secretin GspD n=1 Tax=Rhodopila sp. TaxID=2480087 RepID=UPI003D0DA4E6
MRQDVVRKQRSCRTLAVLCGLIALNGCNRPSPPAIPALTELPGGAAAAPPRVNGAVGSPGALAPPEIAYGQQNTPPTQTPATAAAAGSGDVSLDFADTDIREVAAQILGGILKVNYTIDPAVHGTATLHTVQPLTRAQVVPALESLLAQNGAALTTSGGLYRVLPIAQAVAVAASGPGTAGAEVVPLRYATAEDLAKVLQPYVGQGGKIAADPARNALLISGEPAAREGLIGLVQAFDVDVLARQSYAVLPVSNGDVKDFAQALQDAFRGQSGGAGGGTLAGLVRVIPLSRINAVLLVSPQPRYIDEARRVYALIDRARQKTIRSWHVYYLQNSHSEDVAYVLQQAFTPNNVTAQPTAARSQSQQSQGGGSGGLSGSNGGGGGGGLGGGGLGAGSAGSLGRGNLSSGISSSGGGGPGLGQQGTSPNQGGAPAAGASQAPPAAGANPLLGGLEPGGGGDQGTDTLRVIPDDQNNSVMVYGTAQELSTMEAMLRKIDILPLQVRIDAVIAEVTLNDALQYGTQFFFKSGGINGILNTQPQTANVASPSAAALNLTFPGFFLGGSGAGGVPFALEALQQVTKVHVLSSPELMVLDNQPARLQVGAVVPYLAQSSQSTITSNAPIVSSINYQQTGVILEVTPRVNSGGLVTLDVMQDVSSVATTITTPGVDSPTFNERNVSSRVVVQDGQTIGLAGLITDTASVGNQGIPWLKDIPLLGLLAGNQNNTRQRTELLILITPHVVHDQRDARALTEDLRDHLINAAAVPGFLNNLGPSGQSDPSLRLRRQLQLQQ